MNPLVRVNHMAAASTLTGTGWSAHEAGHTIRLERLGDIPGPRWLSSDTTTGRVVLQADSALSGTRWFATAVP
jgi:hypothetical protein